MGFGLAFKNPKTLTRGGIAWLRPTGIVLSDFKSRLLRSATNILKASSPNIEETFSIVTAGIIGQGNFDSSNGSTSQSWDMPWIA